MRINWEITAEQQRKAEFMYGLLGFVVRSLKYNTRIGFAVNFAAAIQEPSGNTTANSTKLIEKDK